MDYEKVIKELLNIYNQIEKELIQKIIDKLQFEDIKPTTEWLIEQLNKIGLLDKETIHIIAKNTSKTDAELLSILNNIGYNSLPNIPQLEVFKKSNVIKNIIENAYDENTKMLVKINEDIVKSTRKAYADIINQVYLETTTGIYDYRTSLRKAINRMSDKGITTATYVSEDAFGNKIIKNYSIEGVIRRDLMTSVHQLAGNVNQKSIEETHPKYVKITEHENCREQHLEWQGCYVKTEDFKGLTDYGSITGIEGINCRHLHYAFFGEIDTNKSKIVNGYTIYTQDKKISDKQAEKTYKLSQKQRYIERQIRKFKRREELWKDKDEDEFIKAKEKRKYWQLRMREFIKNHKELHRDYIREKI